MGWGARVGRVWCDAHSKRVMLEKTTKVRTPMAEETTKFAIHSRPFFEKPAGLKCTQVTDQIEVKSQKVRFYWGALRCRRGTHSRA